MVYRTNKKTPIRNSDSRASHMPSGAKNFLQACKLQWFAGHETPITNSMLLKIEMPEEDLLAAYNPAGVKSVDAADASSDLQGIKHITNSLPHQSHLSSWANSDFFRSPKSKPHSLTFLSAEPVAMMLESVEMSMHRTGELPPYSVWNSCTPSRQWNENNFTISKFV